MTEIQAIDCTELRKVVQQLQMYGMSTIMSHLMMAYIYIMIQSDGGMQKENITISLKETN